MFGDFKLKSGRRSPYFFNLGAVADGSGHDIVGTAYANEVARLPVRPEVLFGPAYKGIPLAVATAMALNRDHGLDIGAAFNRKEAKTHGEGGTLVGAAMDGRRVAIVDDVVTDGAAKREAHKTIIAAGGEVVGIVLALDRQEAATDQGDTAVGALERDLGVPVRCVANLDDLAVFLRSSRLDEQYRKVAIVRILQVLAESKLRATYETVGGVIGVPARSVGGHLGNPRPEASWVVRADSRKPSGYTQAQLHQDLFSNEAIIGNVDQLSAMLGWPAVKTRVP